MIFIVCYSDCRQALPASYVENLSQYIRYKSFGGIGKVETSGRMEAQYFAEYCEGPTSYADEGSSCES